MILQKLKIKKIYIYIYLRSPLGFHFFQTAPVLQKGQFPNGFRCKRFYEQVNSQTASVFYTNFFQHRLTAVLKEVCLKMCWCIFLG